jgi:5-methylcytosine-specific restriction endonuclease McrA
MNKTEQRRLLRKEVFEKFYGQCAYCGEKLELNKFQIDNLFPTCRVCNGWKHSLSLEQFRYKLSQQLKRLRKNSSNYRIALKYDMITEKDDPIEFYFEHIEKVREVWE